MATNKKEISSDLDKTASHVMQDAVVSSLQSMFPHIPVGAIREGVTRQSKLLIDPLDQIRLTNNCIDELLSFLVTPTCTGTTAGPATDDIVDLTQGSPVGDNAPIEETGCTVIDLDQFADLVEISDSNSGDQTNTNTDLKICDSAPQTSQGTETSLPETQASCSSIKSSQVGTKSCDPALKICEGSEKGLPQITETSKEVTQTKSTQGLSPSGALAVECSETIVSNTEFLQQGGKRGQITAKAKPSSTLSKCPCRDCSKHQIQDTPEAQTHTKPHQLLYDDQLGSINGPQSIAVKTLPSNSASLKRNREEESEHTAVNVPSIQQSQADTMDQNAPRKPVTSHGDEMGDIMRARLQSVDDALLRLSQKVKSLEQSKSNGRPSMATTTTQSFKSNEAPSACAGVCAGAHTKNPIQHASPRLMQSAQSPKPGSSPKPELTNTGTSSTALKSFSDDESYNSAKGYTAHMYMYKASTAEQKVPGSHHTQHGSLPAGHLAVPSVSRSAPHVQSSLITAKNNHSQTLESRSKECKPKALLSDPAPRDTLRVGISNQQRPPVAPLKNSHTSTLHQKLYPPGASKKTEQGTVHLHAQQKNFSSVTGRATQLTANSMGKSAVLKTSNAASTSSSGSGYISQGPKPKQAVQKRTLETDTLQTKTAKNETQTASDKQVPPRPHNGLPLLLQTAPTSTLASMPQQVTQPAQQPQMISTTTSVGQNHPPLPTLAPMPGLRPISSNNKQPQMLLPGQKPGEPASVQDPIPRPGPAMPTLPAVSQPSQSQVLPANVPAPQPPPVEQPLANPPVPADEQPPGPFPGQGGDNGKEKTIEQLKSEVLMLFHDVDPAYVVTMLQAAQHYPSPTNEVCLHLLENANYPKAKKEDPKPPALKKTQETIDVIKDYYKLPPCREWGATFLQLQNDFRMLSVDCIRAICTLHGYHYAPTRVCLEEIMCNNEQIRQLLPRVKYSSYSERKILVEITTKDSKGKDIKSKVHLQVLKGRRHATFTKPYSDLPENMKQEIDSYEEFMKNSALEKDRLLAWMMNENEYEAEGQLIECGCCYLEVSFEKMVQCLNGDLFCEMCLQRYAKEAIYGEGKATLTCMTTGCDSSYPRDQLEKCLSAQDMAKYDERVREESIKLASMDDLVRCPHCDFAALLDPGIKVFACQNTDCKKETCRHCGEDWKDHFGKRCEEIEKRSETNVRTSYEERMSQAQIRTCHKCKTGIMKDQGCNKMTCRCGAKMCYICRQPNIDYNHFCGHARNPGEGCTVCIKCSLWTDPAEDDARAVKELEKELEEEKEKITRAKDSRSCVDAPELAPEPKKQKVM